MACAGVMSAVLFGHRITANFVIGITIVCISMHQFFTEPERLPAQAGTSKVHVSPSMEHMMETGPALPASHNGRLTERSSLLPR